MLRHRLPVLVQQVHAHIGQAAGLPFKAHLLIAQQHRTFNDRGAEGAGVHLFLGRARAQGEGLRLAVGRGLLDHLVFRALAEAGWLGEHIGGDQGEAYAVGVGHQAFQQVAAIGPGNGLRRGFAIAVDGFHYKAFKPGFASLHHAVQVAVLKQPAADGGRQGGAGVEGQLAAGLQIPCDRQR